MAKFKNKEIVDAFRYASFHKEPQWFVDLLHQNVFQEVWVKDPEIYKKTYLRYNGEQEIIIEAGTWIVKTKDGFFFLNNSKFQERYELIDPEFE